jgi:hypothetical protein
VIARRKEIGEYVADYALEIEPPLALVQLRELFAAPVSIRESGDSDITINANSASNPAPEEATGTTSVGGSGGHLVEAMRKLASMPVEKADPPQEASVERT